MFDKQKLKTAGVLFKYAFVIYRWLYFNFKNRKDHYNLQLLNTFIKPGFVVLDIGANIGFFSRFLSDKVGATGHVYCFEPDAINFRHLKNELKSKTNTTLLQKAVAAESGMLTLYTSNLLNVDHRTYKHDNYAEQHSIEKMAIDDYINNQFKVDLIKMDIQGFEMEALKGMKKTLEANPNLILFTEFWAYGLQQAGSSAMEVFDFLTQLNFNVYRIDNAKLSVLTIENIKQLKVDLFSDINVLASRNTLHF